jgi:putative hemolysin
MSAITLEIVFIILLMAANGLLAMSELAVISARKPRLVQRARGGDTGAQTALELAQAPNRFLATVQIGITLIGILAGAVGGATIAEKLGGQLARISWLAAYSEAIGIVLVVLAITYLSLILGELVPKRLALQHPERLASLLSTPMRVLSILAFPAVSLLSLSTDLVLRVLRIRPSTEPPVTEAEIKALITQGTQAGVFEEAELDLVERVFRLADWRVSALMTPRPDVVWLDLDEPLEKMQRTLTESGHYSFPVGQGRLDNLLGVVHAKDLLARGLAGQPVDLRGALQEPFFLFERTRVLQALELFREAGTHIGLVIDEYSSIQGVLTLQDILEAIVGDISPTDETVEPLAVQREDGSWLIDGLLPLDEFKKLFQIEALPGEERGYYQTIAGFVITHLDRIPSASDRFAWQGLRFEVIDMDGPRIDKLLVAPETGQL